MIQSPITRLLVSRENRVIRAQDADFFSNPPAELARLERSGSVQKLSHGLYLIVPEERRGQFWRPPIEAVALGVAVASYGRDVVALMGISAARLHSAIPRALAVSYTHLRA